MITMFKSKITFPIIIVLVIVILFALFSFFLHNTRAISETRLVLEIKSNKADTNSYYISNINTLDSVVSKLNSRFDDKNLLAIYEREREHYIMLLTVVAILLIISVAYTIIHRIVENDVIKEQTERIKTLENNYKAELQTLTQTNIITNFVNFGHELTQANVSYIDENTNAIINTEDGFIKYLKYRSKDILELIRDGKINRDIPTIAIDIRNFINGAMVYSKTKGFIKNTTWDTQKNTLFKAIITWIEDILGKDKYNTIKDAICKLPYVEWKDV